MPPMAPHKLRWLQLQMQLQLEEAEERERAILGTVIWLSKNRNPRRRRWRCAHGSSDASCLASMTLMEELQQESQGDFVSFLRIDPAMFHELLVRVSPIITKIQRYVPQYTMSDTNLPYFFLQFTWLWILNFKFLFGIQPLYSVYIYITWKCV